VIDSFLFLLAGLVSDSTARLASRLTAALALHTAVGFSVVFFCSAKQNANLFHNKISPIKLIELFLQKGGKKPTFHNKNNYNAYLKKKQEILVRFA
jgi:hypothetical protein